MLHPADTVKATAYRCLWFPLVLGLLCLFLFQGYASDTTRINTLNGESMARWYADPAKAEQLAAEALSLARQEGFIKGEMDALRNLGVSNDVMGRYDEALQWYALALVLADSVSDRGARGALLNNIGLAKFNLGRYHEASALYLEALPILEQTGPPLRTASVLNNLGLVYHETGRYAEALAFHQRALAIREAENNKHGMGASLHNIGQVHEDMKEYELALMHYDRSAEIKRSIDDRYGLGATLNNVGNIHLNAGRFVQAEQALLESIRLRGQIDDLSGLASAHYNLSLVYQRSGQYAAAIAQALTGLDYARRSGAMVREYRIYGGLMQTYREMGDFEKALHYYEQFSLLKDSVLSVENSRYIARLMQEFETREKEQKIELLNRENELGRLQVLQQRSRMRLLGVGFLGLTSALLMLGLYLRKRQAFRHALQLESAQQQAQQRGFRAVMEAQENQRRSIARELHDGLGQILSTAKLQLHALAGGLPASESSRIEESMAMIDEAVTELRQVSHQMMPATLTRLGLVPALRDMVRRVSGTGQLSVEMQVEEDFPRLDFDIEVAVYRIVQELLQNTLKHAGADRAFLSLATKAKQIHLQYGDNGRGLPSAPAETGMGLDNIRVRLALFQGSLHIDPGPGEGLTMQILLPLH